MTYTAPVCTEAISLLAKNNSKNAWRCSFQHWDIFACIWDSILPIHKWHEWFVTCVWTTDVLLLNWSTTSSVSWYCASIWETNRSFTNYGFNIWQTVFAIKAYAHWCGLPRSHSLAWLSRGLVQGTRSKFHTLARSYIRSRRGLHQIGSVYCWNLWIS